MIKTIFMGTPEFAVPILNTLIKNTQVQLVITKPDSYVGRKKILTYPPIKEIALKNNIPVIQPIKIADSIETIKKYAPDLIVTCAYGQIVPSSILNIPRLGCINVHASLLPKYRGGAPIHHALINGDTQTGITIMYMDEGMDSGDIIKSQAIPIAENDNVQTLSAKLSQLGSQLLDEVLPSIINEQNNRVKQQIKDVTYAKIIKREDEHLDFTNKAAEINNRVRGVYPNSYFILNGLEIKVLEGYVGKQSKSQPATIVELKKDAIGIACKDKIYYITKLKPFGKKEMLALDYLNGINKEQLLNSKVN